MPSRLAGRATATGSRPVVVLPSESSTIAAGGRFFAGPSTSSSAASRASPVAVPPSAARAVDQVGDLAVVVGGRLDRVRVGRERHGAHARLVGQLLEEALRRRARGLEPARLDVVGQHRARHVGHQHDRGLLAAARRRSPAGAPARARARRAPPGTARAAPGGARRHPRQQRRQRRDAGEADRVAARPPAAPARSERARAARARAPRGRGARRSSRQPPAELARPVARRREHHVLGACAPQRRRHRRAFLSAAASAKRSRRRRSAVSTSTRAPGLGVDHRQCARPRAARARAGRAPRRPARCGARPSAASGRAQSSGRRRSRRRPPPGCAARPGGPIRSSARRAARRSRRRRPRPRASARRRPTRAPRPPRGGSSRVSRRAEGQQRRRARRAAPRARPARRPRPRPRRSSAGRRCRTPSTGDTSTAQPGGEQPLGHLLAHVRDAGARRRRRVELAHVVAGLVGAQLRELGARAHPGAAVLAGAARPPARRTKARSSASTSAPGQPGPGPWRRPAGRRAQPPEAHAASGLRAPGRAGRARARPRAPVSSRSSGRDALAQPLVAEHEPVAQHLGREVANVAGQHVAPAAQQRQRARRLHEADRPARDWRRSSSSGLDLVEPVAARAGGWRRPGRPRSRSPRGRRTRRAAASRKRSRSATVSRSSTLVRRVERAVHHGRLVARAPGSRRGSSSGSGRPGPRAAGRCPRTRSGSGWRARGTGSGTG